MSNAVSIHIGVNEPGFAFDMRARLPDSETSAWRMAELASQAGYDSMLVLRGSMATVGAVNAALWNVSQLLAEGDSLLVTFSGHGNQVRDMDAEERSGSDQSWSLYDGELLDDTLAGYWRLFKPGVRIVVVSESCYSGGMYRGDDESVYVSDAYPAERRMRDGGGTRPVYRGAQTAVEAAAEEAIRSCIASPPADRCEIRASVLMLTASAEHQPSRAGLFTDCLLQVWENGGFPGTYCELHREVKTRVMASKCDQEPQILMVGSPDPGFPLERAFHRTRGPGGRSRGTVYRGG